MYSTPTHTQSPTASSLSTSAMHNPFIHVQIPTVCSLQRSRMHIHPYSGTYTPNLLTSRVYNTFTHIQTPMASSLSTSAMHNTSINVQIPTVCSLSTSTKYTKTAYAQKPTQKCTIHPPIPRYLYRQFLNIKNVQYIHLYPGTYNPSLSTLTMYNTSTHTQVPIVPICQH